MSGLFSTFNVATRGMSAQQKALDVTAHNISNANTEGYSRQRATMETTRPFGMPSMNNAMGVGQLGTGVQISAIVRIRDTFLDYQVRTENGTMGYYTGREKFLSEIESIMNEPSDSGVSSLMDGMFNSWQSLAGSPESSNTRTVVAEQSRALTYELNNTYNQLIKIKGNSQDVIKQGVVDVNNMLDQINELNTQVIAVKVGGNEPNDLMDKRDLLVDQLSFKFGITIDKKTFGGQDIRTNEEGMENAYLVKSGPSEDVKRFSYINSIEPIGTPDEGEDQNYKITYYKKGDMSSDDKEEVLEMTLDSDQYKRLDQGRVIWADKDGNAIGTDIEKPGFLFTPKTGELQGYMSVQADIDKYVGELDALAKGIAFSINAVHSGESDAAKPTGILDFFVNSKDVTAAGVTTAAGEAEITAGNITVNKKILEDPMLINTGENATSGPTDNTRALAIAQLRYIKLEIQGIEEGTTREGFLTGDKVNIEDGKVSSINSSSNGTTISGYFTDVVSRLGTQTQTAKKTVTNHEALLAGLNESRASISGVSLDEEMANMIQYQHAYQANAKIISTVDELLDLVINGLKR
ncbi:flagellar hook-associated protein FlgK [Clostridium sp.]|uniref:flagellar hook-associated protein FlgK n=1 Tax=Clostridium sp. TaxID=1506 RepID=UPI001A50AA85|nr:flagellar hook-associated protein FlgK [Clostridium sp.]MBK5240381.1 flagellar hook-associated protein FlgK [Clostridium sp.]